MSAMKALLALSAAVSMGFCQSVNISGKVTDTSQTPLPGASVRLENGGQTATTGADGSFTLSGPAGIIGKTGRSLPHLRIAAIHNGKLFVDLQEKSVVKITAYTLQGKAVSIVQKTMDAGSHSLALPLRGAGVYVYKVKSGANEFLIKGPSICRETANAAATPRGFMSNDLFRQARRKDVIDDVIAVTKDGYLNYRVTATNSDTSGIEIRMIVCAGTVTDADGNVYQSVKIGSQVWTTENLRTTKLNDGTPIPHVIDNFAWTGDTYSPPSEYCYYNNTADADSIKKFGALYSWTAVATQKLAPAGWHVPADSEWDALQNYLIANGYDWDGTTTDNKIAKSLAAKADWVPSSEPGSIGIDLRSNNRTGFSALPAGYRNYLGNFTLVGDYTVWWSATSPMTGFGDYRCLTYSQDNLFMYGSYNSYGISVRLVKDN